MIENEIFLPKVDGTFVEDYRYDSRRDNMRRACGVVVVFARVIAFRKKFLVVR